MREDDALPVVAVVGRPNVGKSSLVNRFIGRRDAIVDPTPGVTRDRRAFAAEWRGRGFEVVDTGGLEVGAQGLEARIAEQAQVALEAADVVILVVDGVAGTSEDDLMVADILRRAGKPVVVAVNKLDDPRDEPIAAEFFRLGLGEPVPVSALHGRGSGDLLDVVVAALPERGGRERTEWASIAIVGRPNVGKSSLLNALAGMERSLVDAAPGTTRDPVDVTLTAHGRALRIVDTAGLRRATKIDDPLEYYSSLRARRTLTRADAVVLVVDGSEGVTGLDQRLAEDVVDEGRAAVVVVNKWDLAPVDEADRRRYDHDLSDRLRFVSWARVLRTVAVTGRGVDRVLPAVTAAVDSHRRRLETAAVNRLVRDAQDARPPPRRSGRTPRILYSVQAAVAPPRFILFATGALEPTYLRYLERRVRELEPFEGTPVRLETRVRSRAILQA